MCDSAVPLCARLSYTLDKQDPPSLGESLIRRMCLREHGICLSQESAAVPSPGYPYLGTRNLMSWGGGQGLIEIGYSVGAMGEGGPYLSQKFSSSTGDPVSSLSSYQMESSRRVALKGCICPPPWTRLANVSNRVP